MAPTLRSWLNLGLLAIVTPVTADPRQHGLAAVNERALYGGLASVCYTFTTEYLAAPLITPVPLGPPGPPGPPNSASSTVVPGPLATTVTVTPGNTFSASLAPFLSSLDDQVVSFITDPAVDWIYYDPVTRSFYGLVPANQPPGIVTISLKVSNPVTGATFSLILQLIVTTSNPGPSPTSSVPTSTALPGPLATETVYVGSSFTIDLRIFLRSPADLINTVVTTPDTPFLNGDLNISGKQIAGVVPADYAPYPNLVLVTLTVTAQGAVLRARQAGAGVGVSFTVQFYVLILGPSRANPSSLTTSALSSQGSNTPAGSSNPGGVPSLTLNSGALPTSASQTGGTGSSQTSSDGNGALPTSNGGGSQTSSNSNGAFPTSNSGSLSAPSSLGGDSTTSSAAASASGIKNSNLTTLNCVGTAYEFIGNELYTVSITLGGVTTLLRGLLDGVLGTAEAINALAYHPQENYLYGISVNSTPQYLVRIGAGGSFEAVGPDAIIPATVTTAQVLIGDIDDQKQYWLGYNDGRGYIVVDLDISSSNYGLVIESGIALGFVYPVGDWAYVPDTRNGLWALGQEAVVGPGNGSVTSYNTHLVFLDLDTYIWADVYTFVGVQGGGVGRAQWGAIYPSNDGFLYASESNSGELWKFPLNPTAGSAGAFVALGVGPRGDSLDGARCVLSSDLSAVLP